MNYKKTQKMNNIVRIGQLSSEKSQAGTVYHEGGVAQTITAGTHGYAIGYIVTEICADRQNQLLHRRELLERDYG